MPARLCAARSVQLVLRGLARRELVRCHAFRHSWQLLRHRWGDAEGSRKEGKQRTCDNAKRAGETADE